MNPDSVSLDFQHGYWGGADFRIVLTRSGDVRVSPDSVAHGRFRVRHLPAGNLSDHLGFGSFTFEGLPPVIQRDATYGQFCSTDMPTMIVTFYGARGSKSVADYQGCVYAPYILRSIEHRILTLAAGHPLDEDL